MKSHPALNIELKREEEEKTRQIEKGSRKTKMSETTN